MKKFTLLLSLMLPLMCNAQWATSSTTLTLNDVNSLISDSLTSNGGVSALEAEDIAKNVVNDTATILRAVDINQTIDIIQNAEEILITVESVSGTAAEVFGYVNYQEIF